jgi:hypothetical protein
MTKHKGFIAVCLVLLIAALGAPSALGAAGGTDRPLHGTVSGTFGTTFVTPSTGTFSGGGSGNLAHLGEVTMTMEGTFSVSEFEATLNGTITFVSANGDELTGTFTGSLALVTGQVGIGGPIAGGTGRFEDASGSFDALGSVYVDTFEFSITGVISY